ncbi:MAG TPA: hypothetical protein VJN18_23185 [Polyangiaceae bacterium]|nr:hypothetical protein [Polyangiaceae bacterium]
MVISLRSSFSSLGAACWFAFALLLVTGTAAAELKDAAVREQAKLAMEDDYLATRFKQAEQKLKKAIGTCGKKKCSNTLQAQLRADLAVVYIAGLKKPDKGKRQLKEALEIDPAVQVDPNYSTPEVDAAFLSLGGVKEDPMDEEREAAAAAAAAAAAEEAKRARAAAAAPRNWFALALQQEFLMYEAQRGVCSGAEQYECFRGATSYRMVYPQAGNEINTGFGLATRRVLFGYERVFLGRISAGGRIGFAFGGRPNTTIGTHPGFNPLHLELRGSYWFGKAPFERKGLRPYAGLAAGFGEVNGSAAVYVYPSEAHYRAGQYLPVDAWRKTGAAFVSIHGGVAHALHPSHAVALEIRLLQMLGDSALGAAASLGYSFGL